MVQAILFDFDNTIAFTESLRDIREHGDYEQLTPETMAKAKVYKPIPTLLKGVREAGTKIGLVTNAGRGYIARVLAHLGLENEFDTIVTYTDVKKDGMKPSPNGLLLALKQLGVSPSTAILYVGDENIDHQAAYRAGITPVMPTWATKKPVSTAPALDMSSDQLLDYLKNPSEYQLFAERSAELGTAVYARTGVYFLPLDDSANVVTLKREMTSFCLGRYYSQKSATTALLHEKHNLSKEIQRKEAENPFNIPTHWSELFAHTIRHGATFVFDEKQVNFEVVTVIPSKKNKDQRLERLLDMIKKKMEGDQQKPLFIKDMFYYVDDAQSQKFLPRDARSFEANRALQLLSERAKVVEGKRVLIIDDVTTTGSTMRRARELALFAGAAHVTGVALAKTVSLVEDERPCPACGLAMKVKRNAMGEHFWGCTGFNDPSAQCRHTESLVKKVCPSCGRDMRVNTNKFTKVKFWSCTGWNQTPACNHSLDMDKSETPT